MPKISNPVTLDGMNERIYNNSWHRFVSVAIGDKPSTSADSRRRPQKLPERRQLTLRKSGQIGTTELAQVGCTVRKSNIDWVDIPSFAVTVIAYVPGGVPDTGGGF